MSDTVCPISEEVKRVATNAVATVLEGHSITACDFSNGTHSMGDEIIVIDLCYDENEVIPISATALNWLVVVTMKELKAIGELRYPSFQHQFPEGQKFKVA